jgi:hypothetical protein
MSTAFIPSQLPNLNMWFDGTDPLNNGRPPNDGDVVPFWHDKSSNSNLMTCQTIDTHPGIYHRSMQCEKGGIHFNNSVYSSGLTDISQNSDIFIVMRADPSINNTNICSLYDPNLEEFNSLTRLNNKWIIDSKHPERKVGAVVQELSSQCIMLQWSVANNNYHVYKNGLRILFSNCLSYTPGGQLNFYLGTTVPDSSNDYIGEIGEIIVCNSQLDMWSRQMVEGYLAWKWNISLPIGHPFYGKQPLV